MAGTKHTAGPWSATDNSWEVSSVYGPDDCLIAEVHIHPSVTEHNQHELEPVNEANARLIAAAPSMADAIMGLIGLCQLLRNRDDCPSEIRQALTHNHRIIAGYEALSAAGIDGFQPSDFDLAKAEASHD